ncbi:hypothetical protein ACSZMR_21610 [Aeromonas veronii]
MTTSHASKNQPPPKEKCRKTKLETKGAAPFIVVNSAALAMVNKSDVPYGA